MFRGFIAIDIEVNQKILDFINEIRNTRANIRLVEPENIHITLKFLGDTEEKHISNIEEIMGKSVQNIEPFEIKLIGSGVFPNTNYIKVIWIGLQNWETIGKIAEDINKQLNKLGFKKEKRKFSPHLTIARVRSARNKDKIIQVLEKYRDKDFSSFKVDNIKLKKSELTPKGPIYTDLKKVKF